MNISLSLSDVGFAALLALLLTWLYLGVSKSIKRMLRPVALGYQESDAQKVLAKCYGLFPISVVLFHGREFRRGMSVRVVTNGSKVFEGKLIGINSDNMVCLVNRRYIIAQDLNNIDDIVLLSSGPTGGV